MSKKEKIIFTELNLWREQKMISQELYDTLSARYEIPTWDIRTIIRWTLIFGAIMLGIGVISFIMLIFKSLTLVVLILTGLSVLGYYYGFLLTSPTYAYYYPKTGNALIAVACLILCGDIFALGKLLSSGSGHWSILLLITSAIYFAIAYYKRNTLVLVFALIAIATWFGTESGYISGWGAYFLGLNYPFRFALVSPLVVIAGFLHKKLELNVPESFIKTYYAVGLLYVNLSLWVMSIFGNYGDIHNWQYHSTHLELLIFVIIWGMADIGIFIIGARFKNKMFVGYAIVFLILNLYTRYFEYFWDSIHKSLFFIIPGGISLGLGLYFEKRISHNSKSDTNIIGEN